MDTDNTDRPVIMLATCTHCGAVVSDWVAYDTGAVCADCDEEGDEPTPLETPDIGGEG